VLAPGVGVHITQRFRNCKNILTDYNEAMVALPIYTAKDAAEKIGCSVATVSRWASRLGMTAKHGPALSLTEDDVQLIEAKRHRQAGNPNFGKEVEKK
jgi:uncharacterized protein YjcR